MNRKSRTFAFCYKKGLILKPVIDADGIIRKVQTVPLSYVQKLDESSMDYQVYQQSIDSGSMILTDGNNVAIVELNVKGPVDNKVLYSVPMSKFMLYMFNPSEIHMNNKNGTFTIDANDIDIITFVNKGRSSLGTEMNKITNAANKMGG